MRLLALLLFVVVGSTTALVEVGTPRGYHEEVGISLASKIKASEDAIISKQSRIVGGVIAPLNKHPFLAGLLINFWNIAGTSACGASLLTPDRLLTAAHCWFDGVNQASQFTVVLGSHFLFSGGQRILTRQVVPHPQWTPSRLANDVAMIYLPVQVTFTSSIQPITIPDWHELGDLFVGNWATAAGYGLTSDQQTGVSSQTSVSQVNLQVITEAQCRAVYGANFILPSTLCTNGAGGVGVCRGDSGGPLFINRGGRRVLIGVSSFVAQNGCQLGYPSAFARVTSFYSFITQHMCPLLSPLKGICLPYGWIGEIPRGPSADWRVLTTADAVGTNGLTCLRASLKQTLLAFNIYL
ncbi:unnamed protein product [Chilo suppressalis]|uniref:Peptidase S1 domain-containing protein n=1 Tax=Chilo suppressalis TaxID=168631 RepID=A0ABN8B3K8_CHISP|nr:unnamed protein product [Chilo suppressalis]